VLRQPVGAPPFAHSAFVVCISVDVILLSTRAVFIASLQSSAGVVTAAAVWNSIGAAATMAASVITVVAAAKVATNLLKQVLLTTFVDVSTENK
jgi:hypothetical protein